MSNVLAIVADAALQDDAFYKFSLSKNKEAKGQDIYRTGLFKLPYVRSSTNFVFFHSKKDIRDLGPQMLEEGVRIGRPFRHFTTGVELARVL